MRRFTTAVAIGVCLLSGTGAVHAEDRALIVGIGAAYGNLPSAQKDIELATAIAGKMGLSSSAIRTLTENEATKEAILSGLSWVKDGIKDGGKGFIYYSGHGTQETNLVGDEDDGCDEAWVPVDFRKGSKFNFIIDDEIGKILEGIGRGQVLIVSDSCHSGTMTKALASSDLQSSSNRGKFMKSNAVCGEPVNKSFKSIAARQSKGAAKSLNTPSVVAFSAAADNEVALAGGGGKGSLLTQAIFDVLQEKPDLSFLELREEVAARIIAESANIKKNPHHPQLTGAKELFTKNIKLEAVPGSAYQAGIENAHNFQELFQRIATNGRFTSIQLSSPKTVFKLNDKLDFTVISDKNGYLNIIEVDSSNNATVIFPNKFKDNNAISAGKELHLPSDIGGFNFRANAKEDSTLYALVSKEPLNLYKDGMGEMSAGFKSLKSSNFGNIKRSLSSKLTKSKGVINVEEGGNDTKLDMFSAQLLKFSVQ